jgi:hypothetical protein
MSAALAVMEDNRHSATYTEAENLARRVLARMDSMTAKLKSLEDDIRRLWLEFDKLKAGETILGCATKKEFCERKLNRTPRAVRYMLDGGNDSRGETISPAPAAPPSDAHFATARQRTEYRQDFRKAHPEYANRSNAEVDAVIYPPPPEPKEIPLEDAFAAFLQKNGATYKQAHEVVKKKLEEYSKPTPPKPAPTKPKPVALTPEEKRASELQVFAKKSFSRDVTVTVCARLAGLTPFHFKLEIDGLEESDLRAAVVAAFKSRQQRQRKASR